MFLKTTVDGMGCLALSGKSGEEAINQYWLGNAWCVVSLVTSSDCKVGTQMQDLSSMRVSISEKVFGPIRIFAAVGSH